MANLDYRALAVLDAVAASGSFDKAALALGISQSAVSQRIKALEDLGVRTREIFLAVQLEGLNYVAAGERFGVSVTTVKNHLIRAMTQCLLLVES